MIKSELIKRIASATPRLRQRDVESVVEAMLDQITQGLADGRRVEIRGFGVFATKQWSARIGRNPRTGVEVAISEKSVPSFKTGKDMRKRLNKAVPSAARARD